MAKMTPKTAWFKECRWCSGCKPYDCITQICSLSPNVLENISTLKRIKAHCLDCAALDIGESPQLSVKKCDGHILRENHNSDRWVDKDGVNRGLCFLHKFRFGKNPNRKKRTLTEAHKAKLLASLKSRGGKTIL